MIQLAAHTAQVLVMVERLFLAVPQGCLRFVIVVFPDHTHLLFLAVRRGDKYRYAYSSLRRVCMIPTHTAHLNILKETSALDDDWTLLLLV